MRFLWLFSILFLSLVPNEPLAAQEHRHHHAQVAPVSPPGFEQYLKLIEMPPQFGDWAYRHDELHDLGLVAKLRMATGSSCCNGEKSGECRVTKVNLVDRKVYVDRQWCPYYYNTKVVVMSEMETIHDNGEDVAMVCAGRTIRVQHAPVSPNMCPGVYCIAVRPAKM